MKLTEKIARAQATITRLSDAPTCGGKADFWAAAERAHMEATSAPAAMAAAAPAMALCAKCPLRTSGECHAIAVDGDYTGLAAGAAYGNGVRRSPAEVDGRLRAHLRALEEIA